MVLGDTLVSGLESAATELAAGAGEILAGHFGRRISIEYKDKEQRDPVTSVDKACQSYLSGEIARKFPGHGILGEESASGDNDQEDQAAAPEFLWVLDPLDGTTNYLNGLPVYASSIGVLHRGRLVVGALYLPWPNSKGGVILHCRKGGGCFIDEEQVSVYESEEPAANRLVGLPGSFSQVARFSRRFNSKAGETRITGSVAYELAMTACGVLQYSFFGAPRIWDVAGGGAGRDGSQRRGHDTVSRGEAVAPPGVVDAVLERKAAHHEGVEGLDGSPGGGQPPRGAPGGPQHTPPL